MCLHEIDRQEMVICQSKIPLSFVPVDFENAKIVKNLRGKKYIKKFKKQLKNGDYGLYAFCDGVVVGYGWQKNAGSKDLFYIIDDGCSYLSQFFVNSTYRGKNIYPVIINELINTTDYNKYYIAAYDTNTSSLRGISKVGFSFVRHDVFVRFLKKTFFKKRLV